MYHDKREAVENRRKYNESYLLESAPGMWLHLVYSLGLRDSDDLSDLRMPNVLPLRASRVQNAARGSFLEFS